MAAAVQAEMRRSILHAKACGDFVQKQLPSGRLPDGTI
jgi:hypothetical protein